MISFNDLLTVPPQGTLAGSTGDKSNGQFAILAFVDYRGCRYAEPRVRLCRGQRVLASSAVDALQGRRSVGAGTDEAAIAVC